MADLADFGLVPSTRTKRQAGEKFGRWTLLALGRAPENDIAKAVAQCDCGSPPRVVVVGNLTQGLSKDCGCGRRARLTKHGAAKRTDPVGRRIYKVWRDMMDRCYDPTHKAFPDYGGRGISVCLRWQDAANFVVDMRPSYEGGLSIERRDNDQGYSADNCYWATRLEQNRNRRCAVLVTVKGETKPLIEWVNGNSKRYRTVWARIEKGESPETAIFGELTPRRRRDGSRGRRPRDAVIR